MKERKLSKLALILGGILFSCFLIAPIANALDWYLSDIVVVAPFGDDGSVVLQITRVSGEPFDGPNGKAKVKIEGSDTGANKMLATVLTAISLDTPVSFGMDDGVVPSYYTQYTVKAVGIVPAAE